MSVLQKMMSEITFIELKEKLALIDEITLIDLLNVDSETLVEYLSDIIEEQQDRLKKELEE